MMEIKELCYKVIGAAMRVHQFFGAGFLEEVYKNAMLVELGQMGVSAEAEKELPVDYHGVRVGDYKADIIVENRLILELKAVINLAKAHEAQLVNYLSATGISDGLLLNFGATSLQYKHKYRTYRSTSSNNPVENTVSTPHNPDNPVNPVENTVSTPYNPANPVNPVENTVSTPYNPVNPV